MVWSCLVHFVVLRHYSALGLHLFYIVLPLFFVEVVIAKGVSWVTDRFYWTYVSLSLSLSQLYTKDASSSWKQAGSDGSSQLVLKEPSANVVLLDYISSEKWKAITDFDDHLDDISK